MDICLRDERHFLACCVTGVGDLVHLLFHVYLFFYCSNVVEGCKHVIPDGRTHRKLWVQSLVYCCLTAFGGSFINPALLGIPAPPLVRWEFLVTMITAWWAQHNTWFGASWSQTLGTSLRTVKLFCFEAFRCYVMFSWYNRAIQELQGTSGTFLGSIVVGTLGGSGGLFFPFSKGLAPLSQGAPLNVETAFFAVLTQHIVCGFPNQAPRSDAELIPQTLITIGLIYLRLHPSYVEHILSPVTRALRSWTLLGDQEEQENQPPAVASASDEKKRS